ncbi:uncharacterized protein MICPUCDRAFT_40998 [Micromonas pusilla CCMP1545]|uniref:Predicted protein n=1 Tax=Micromonas pusilla (strain CCMP1545) TaxID=564608 RepID=C1MXM1_MICPC|nr:uncharacterized protein MICPUCDRAFT_40998 [Micromonas pusilla CCMP1545]EEH55485.1 predicted protein [Micromonas pusilla CCMP1545]|eukprot:XP_003060716.1 predicted protein [Micromonas pusilla CCMP1545]
MTGVPFMKGPFSLPSKEAKEAEKKKRAAIARVKKWVEQHMPPEYLEDRKCVVDVSEVQCGDPNCAPIDTIVRLIFPNECGTVFGVPCEAHEVEEEDILSMMPPDEYFAKWAAGEKAEWPLPPEPPDPGEIPDVELRFKVGDRVQCCIARGPDGWAPGVVVSLWYRAPMWPTGQYAPYQIKLDGHDSLIFAPQDKDNCIKACP